MDPASITAGRKEKGKNRIWGSRTKKEEKEVIPLGKILN